MTIYAIHVHEVTHTCPGDPEPHPFDIRRRVIHTTPGGPCRTPVTVHVGATIAVVPCGLRYPAHRQCGACRVIVTVLQTTAEHHGPAPHHVPPGPTGLAPHPCVACRQPLAAVLAPTGHHVLCRPRPTTGMA